MRLNRLELAFQTSDGEVEGDRADEDLEGADLPPVQPPEEAEEAEERPGREGRRDRRPRQQDRRADEAAAGEAAATTPDATVIVDGGGQVGTGDAGIDQFILLLLL